jgi:hypothetical protein
MDLDSPESWLPSAGLSAFALDFLGELSASGAEASATARRDLRSGLSDWISSIY